MVCALGVRGRLQDHRLLHVQSRLCPDMLDAACVVVAKVVVAKTVVFRIEDVFKRGFQSHPLRRIDVALEYGLLDAYAVVLAGLGNSPQPPFSGGVCG